jgi:hypothetical protein
MKRFAVAFYWSCLVVLALGTTAFAAPETSRAMAPLSYMETATAGAPDFLADTKLAATCGVTCLQVTRGCRNTCVGRGGQYCLPVNECTNPCTYICQCENIKFGGPC